MHSEGKLDLAVVIPLEDPRGDVVDHLRTWTRSQTLARDRFQVVLGADGRHPDFERRVAGELGPQDELVSIPHGTLMALYDGAARAAKAPVLILSEAHVRADPGCLEAVAEAFAADPDLDAATIRHRQSATRGISGLSERWFARCFEAWDRAGWARLNTTGVAISADAYTRVGGLDSRLGLYAPSLLSARLDEQGARVRHLEDAVLTHELEDEMGYSLELGGDFARGECVVRRELDAEFCERYFGSAGLYGRRHAYREEIARPMVAALRTAIRESPRDAGWLARELAAHLPARLAGPRPRRAWERTATRFNQALAAASFLPEPVRWRSYVAAHEGNVRAIQLEELTRENGVPPAPGAAAGELGPERLDGVVVGTQALEGAFRWTEPVTMVRFALSADRALLRIHNGAIRGDPAGYLYGVYVDGERVPSHRICGHANAVEILLPEVAEPAESGVVLICRPLVESGNGSGGRRRLGMPITRLELSPA
jgi:hypothetical protein